MSDLIVLFEGRAGDPDTGDGWLPAVALEHLGAGRSEVGIIVGESAEGMVEGISEETFEEIRGGLDRNRDLAALVRETMDLGGELKFVDLDDAVLIERVAPGDVDRVARGEDLSQALADYRLQEAADDPA